MPSLSEVKAEVSREGSFMIEQLQISRINWNFYNTTTTITTTELNDDVVPSSKDIINSAYNFAKCIRSVAEPLLVRHFGDEIMDELFGRYPDIISDHMSNQNLHNINFTISLTKIHS